MFNGLSNLIFQNCGSFLDANRYYTWGIFVERPPNCIWYPRPPLHPTPTWFWKRGTIACFYSTNTDTRKRKSNIKQQATSNRKQQQPGSQASTQTRRKVHDRSRRPIGMRYGIGSHDQTMKVKTMSSRKQKELILQRHEKKPCVDSINFLPRLFVRPPTHKGTE